MPFRLSRGQTLSLLLGFPVAIALNRAAASGADTDQVAKLKHSLGYVDKSKFPDKTCANCSLYKSQNAESGTCTIIPGGTVKAAGWCKSWVP
jgi:hypothetical protein